MQPLKTKTRQQIAQEYGITARTLRRWLKQNKIKLPKRLICPNEQKLIYKTFGHPEQVSQVEGKL